MESPIIVFNRVSTLRRATIKALEARGFKSVESMASLQQAEKQLKYYQGRAFLIIEFTLTNSITDEFTFLKKMKDHPFCSNVPVIITSMKAEKQMVMEAFKLGRKYAEENR